MEPVLRIAEELERRDERVASALGDVETLARAVDEARAQAHATAAFLAGLPDVLARAGEEERAAGEARAAAAGSLRAAEAEEARVAGRGGEDERLAAARASQQARDALRETLLRLDRAREERERLEAEGEARRRAAEELERWARTLAGRLAALPGVAAEAGLEPAPGLGGVLEWASLARGGLLVAEAGLARERDALVREASELVASVSGDPLASTNVAGVRARLARALGDD